MIFLDRALSSFVAVSRGGKNPEKNSMLILIISFHSTRMRRVNCWLSSSLTIDNCYNSLSALSCSFGILRCSWSPFLMLSNCLGLHYVSASYAKVNWWNHLTPKSTTNANVELSSERITQIHGARNMLSTVLWMQPLAQKAPKWLTVRRQAIVLKITLYILIFFFFLVFHK